MTGFGGSDVTIGGTAGATAAIVTGGGAAYTVAVSGMTGDGTVTVTIAAGVAVDIAGNANAASTSDDDTVTFDATAPTVTVEQADGQVDPTNVPSVDFTVVFSEAVTGFGPEDVILGGTAGATTATVSGGGPVYTVTVTGMTDDGTVAAGISAGAAVDAAGNASESSTGADNTVTLDTTVPAPLTTPPPPTPTPIPTPTISIPVVEQASLPSSVSTGIDGTGMDSQGKEVAATGEKLAWATTQDGLQITVPAALEDAEGLELTTFTDPESGVTVQMVEAETGETKSVITIPIADESGTTDVEIKVTAASLSGTGDSAVGKVEKIELEVLPQSVDLSEHDERVGTVQVGLVAEMNNIPEGASIDVEVSDAPPVDDSDSISFVLTQVKSDDGEDIHIGEIAYSVNIVKKTGMDEVLGAASLTLTVGGDWVEAVGLENVFVIRVSDEGEEQILPVELLRIEGDAPGVYVFRILSPEGLSSFTVVSLFAPPAALPLLAAPAVDLGLSSGVILAMTLMLVMATVVLGVTGPRVVVVARSAMATVLGGGAPGAAQQPAFAELAAQLARWQLRMARLQSDIRLVAAIASLALRQLCPTSPQWTWPPYPPGPCPSSRHISGSPQSPLSPRSNSWPSRSGRPPMRPSPSWPGSRSICSSRPPTLSCQSTSFRRR